MKTLAEAYAQCHPNGAPPLERVLLRAGLYRPARVLYPLLSWTTHFELERQLIRDCTIARTMTELQESLDDYLEHPRRGGMLRRLLHLRISTRRLRAVARPYFAAAHAGHPRAVAKGLKIGPPSHGATSLPHLPTRHAR